MKKLMSFIVGSSLSIDVSARFGRAINTRALLGCALVALVELEKLHEAVLVARVTACIVRDEGGVGGKKRKEVAKPGKFAAAFSQLVFSKKEKAENNGAGDKDGGNEAGARDEA